MSRAGAALVSLALLALSSSCTHKPAAERAVPAEVEIEWPDAAPHPERPAEPSPPGEGDEPGAPSPER